MHEFVAVVRLPNGLTQRVAERSRRGKRDRARTGGVSALSRGVLGGAATNLDLGPVVTRAVRLQAATVGSRAMFEEMVRAMELHRLEPVLEVAPRRFDGTAEVIGALAAGGHFGKVCMRAWEAG